MRTGVAVLVATLIIGIVPIVASGQSPSPSPGPVASPLGSPQPSCPPILEGRELAGVEGDFLVQVATLEEDLSALSEAYHDAGDDRAAKAATLEELAALAMSFGRSVDTLRFQGRTRQAATALAIAATTESELALALSVDYQIPVEEPPPILGLPATMDAIAGVRAALGLPEPCPSLGPGPLETPTADEPLAEGPTRDSVEALLSSDVDRGAKYSHARSQLDRLYGEAAYRPELRTIVGPDGKTRIPKRVMLTYIGECQNPRPIVFGDRRFPGSKVGACSTAVINFIRFAQRFRDPANPTHPDVNKAFVRLARTMRSAAINDGVKVKGLDGFVTSDAGQLELD